MKKILVTGFEPFGGEKINPSYEAVRKLPDNVGGLRVIKAELPMSYERAPEMLSKLISKNKPVAVICVGQAGGSEGISLETRAVNVKCSVLPDSDGVSYGGDPVLKGGPSAYGSTLPLEEINKELSLCGIKNSFSENAGEYVCNCVFYTLMDILKDKTDVPGGFINVPFVKEQVTGNDTPRMEQYTVDAAVERIAEKTADTVWKNRSVKYSGFDGAMMDYTDGTEHGKDNYMVSPLSLRFAVILAAAGAKGETGKQLLKAAGFANMTEAREFAADFNAFAKEFAKDLEREKRFYPETENGEENAPVRALETANSVWKNEDIRFRVKEKYLEEIRARFGGEFLEAHKKELAAAINGWVDGKTKGMIRNLFPDDYDMGDVAAVLVNTLYFKDAWENEFRKENTKEDIFTCADGCKTKKEFMSNTSFCDYYEDAETKAVVLPMRGNVNIAVVLGNCGNIFEKLYRAEHKRVSVQIPKFEIETSLDSKELNAFLAERGAVLAFDREKADFSGITDEIKIHVSDVIQKTKIKTDETGIEAAAVTAMVMRCNAIFSPAKPIEFRADRPFSFFIYTDDMRKKNMLFFGRVVK